MLNAHHRITTLGIWTALACSCGAEDANGDTDGSGDTDESSGADTGAAAPGCTTKVVLGRYRTDQCVPGEEVGTITLELTDSCGSWSRDAMGGTKDDSFTRYQCYRDRFCFTVHPGSATCEPGVDDADVDLPVGVCQRDKSEEGAPPMNNFTKILSGTEACPEPPAGFTCPVSAIGDGTPGVVACSG